MPWPNHTLRDIRALVRDNIAGKLPGAHASVPNTVLRVMADAKAGVAHLVLLFVAWVSRQLLPDTAENEWLLRHANIWLGGVTPATFAEGSLTLTGIQFTLLPSGSRFAATDGTEYETLAQIFIGSGPTPVNVRAVVPGETGNQEPGTQLSMVTAVAGIDGVATVVTLAGGVDEETEDSIRDRVLFRIRRPPMGGDADDYVAWAREVPGVTRAWSAPREMGIGTVTIRFMMDDLRSNNNGFPLPGDITTVKEHLDLKRPVAVKDFFVVAPIPEPVDFAIDNLVNDTPAVRAAIEVNVRKLLREQAAPAHAINGVLQPAQTIHREWVSRAILDTEGVVSFTLIMTDHEMPNNGAMGVIGTITYP